jgi:hypothetical protein
VRKYNSRTAPQQLLCILLAASTPKHDKMLYGKMAPANINFTAAEYTFLAVYLMAHTYALLRN